LTFGYHSGGGIAADIGAGGLQDWLFFVFAPSAIIVDNFRCLVADEKSVRAVENRASLVVAKRLVKVAREDVLVIGAGGGRAGVAEDSLFLVFAISALLIAIAVEVV
jgi:hypothetical protein